MKINNSIVFSILAGIFGCCGSICGKLSGSFNEMFVEYEMGVYLIQVSFFILMILFNTVGCTFYAKSLDSCSNSVQPTLISCAANYLFSVVGGYLLFSERISLQWCLGTSLIFTGLVVLLKSDQQYRSDKQD